MGCCTSKTPGLHLSFSLSSFPFLPLESNPLFNNPNKKDHQIIITPTKPVDNSSVVSTAKNSYRGSKLISSIDQFLVNSTDLISERCGNINEVYNLLAPPLGKGFPHL